MAARVLCQKAKQFFWNVVKLNSSPERIAFGVAVGVFIGVTPLYGMHTVLALFAAMLIPRTNKIAILAGTNITIPPLAPLVSWLGYVIGRLILHNPQYPVLNWAVLKSLSVDDITFLYYPLFLGSIVLGVILAVVFYFIALFSIRAMRRAHGHI